MQSWRAHTSLTVVALLAIVAGSTTVAARQQGVATATVSGRIEDSSGAAIVGANITITNVDKNQTNQSKSDEQGRFSIFYLPVGSYGIKVEHEGFTPISREFSLSVGQALDLALRLPVSGVAETADVAAGVPVIETVRTEIAETVLPREIENLPLNGRNYLDLAALTPAVSRANPVGNQRFAETSAVPGTQISVAGQRNINNGFLLDGLSANDDAADLPATFFSQEVISEFQVITSGSIAEYGRASAGIVNIATRSGTNNWHSRLYGFLRNQKLDARNPLAPSKDPLTQTQYGASLGGPLRKDSTFLFGNFEQTRLHNAVVLTILPANVTAINRILDQFNFAGPRITTGLVPAGYKTSNFFGRGDHRINSMNTLAVRYSLYDIDGLNSRGVGGLNAVSRGTGLSNRDQTIALSETATLSMRTINELRFQFTRSRLSAPVNDPIGPAITISGIANLGTSSSSPTARDIDLYELADNFTAVRGAHALKFGMDLLYNRVNITFPGALQGAYTFSSLANLQTGTYITFQQAFGEPSLFQSNPNIGVFAQDEWRVSPDLTLSAGVRYDLQFLPEPISTDHDNIAPRVGIAFSPGHGKLVIRASYGLYFERIPLRATSNALQRDGTKYKVASFSLGQLGAPVFPGVADTFPQGFLPSITTIDPDIENSYNQQASLQVERELTRNTSVAVGYLHTRGLHLILSRNVNVPRFPASAGVPNLGRPNPNYANVSRYESSGDSYYNGLTISMNRRFSHWWGMRVSHTFSKAVDDTGNAFFFTPQDNFNLRDDRGLGDNDQRHRLTLSGIFETPGSRSDSRWSHMINGWQLSYIFSYGSALPFNIQTGTDRNFDTNVNDRPVGVGRNTGEGFDFASFDLRLSRRIHVTDRISMDVIAEGFNVFNRTNLQLPNNIYGTGARPLPSFGRATAASDPRQLQFGLRFSL
jgi:hypothetical protein